MMKKMLILSGLALLALNTPVNAEEEKEPTIMVQYEGEDEQDYILVSDDSDKVEETILASYDDEEDSLFAYDDEQEYESDEEYELV